MSPRLIMALSWLMGCGGASQSRSSSPPMERAYPVRSFIAARGYADSDPAAASRAARAEVSRMIRSQITSTLLLDQRSHDGVGEEHTHHRVEERSSFDHGELIHVDPRFARCDAGPCEAVAYLRRREALRVLGAEYATRSASFRREASAARAAAAPMAFTASLRRAEVEFDALAPRGYALRVIGGAPWAPHAEDQASMERLRVKRARIAAALRVRVLPPKSVDTGLGAALRDALLSAIKQMGLRAEAATRCDEGLALASEARVSCGRGQLGPTCRLRLDVRLLRCPHEEVASPDLSGLELRGVSTRSEADARRRLINRVRPELLRAALRAGLAPFLPVR